MFSNLNDPRRSTWRNSEDQLLTAFVMKYGTNDWSRISSVLRYKTPKQCRARWSEYLDPRLKKHNWTSEEDIQLIENIRRFPQQWRTIGQSMGRSAQQCLSRYEELLQNEWTSEKGENPDVDSPSLFRAEASYPHTQPPIPDAIDLDADEEAMLAEGRARLANVQSRKDKRKHKESIIAQARGLSKLQRERELRQAGLIAKDETTEAERRVLRKRILNSEGAPMLVEGETAATYEEQVEKQILRDSVLSRAAFSDSHDSLNPVIDNTTPVLDIRILEGEKTKSLRKDSQQQATSHGSHRPETPTVSSDSEKVIKDERNTTHPFPVVPRFEFDDAEEESLDKNQQKNNFMSETFSKRVTDSVALRNIDGSSLIPTFLKDLEMVIPIVPVSGAQPFPENMTDLTRGPSQRQDQYVGEEDVRQIKKSEKSADDKTFSSHENKHTKNLSPTELVHNELLQPTCITAAQRERSFKLIEYENMKFAETKNRFENMDEQRNSLSISDVTTALQRHNSKLRANICTPDQQSSVRDKNSALQFNYLEKRLKDTIKEYKDLRMQAVVFEHMRETESNAAKHRIQVATKELAHASDYEKNLRNQFGRV